MKKDLEWQYHDAQFKVNVIYLCPLSLVEVLGYHKLDSKENKTLIGLFADLEVVYPDEAVFQRAVDLRQQRAMSLGDALIAATALRGQLVLATHNTDDFSWIKPLEVFDPIL